MSQSKHTPGPWILDESTDKRSWGYVRAILCNGAGFGPVGPAVCRVADIFSTEVSRANGCLIAAAPDLADALEQLLREIRYLVEDETLQASDVAGNAGIKQAKAALNKAGR